jgi:hypothetical protein
MIETIFFPHVFEKIFLVPAQKHPPGDLFHGQILAGSDDRCLVSVITQSSDILKPYIIFQPDAAFTELVGHCSFTDLAGYLYKTVFGPWFIPAFSVGYGIDTSFLPFRKLSGRPAFPLLKIVSSCIQFLVCSFQLLISFFIYLT